MLILNLVIKNEEENLFFSSQMNYLELDKIKMKAFAKYSLCVMW